MASLAWTAVAVIGGSALSRFLVAALTGAAACCLMIAAGSRPPARARRRLRAAAEARRDDPPTASNAGARWAGLLARLPSSHRRPGPAGYWRALQRRLILAGTPTDLDHVAGAKLALPLVAPLLLVAPAWLAAGSLGGRCTVLTSWLWFFAPDLWLAHRGERRLETAARDLPDVLDLLRVCVEAGMGLELALQRVADQMDGPLAQGLREALVRVGLGQTCAAALQHWAAGLPSPDLESVVAALEQGRSTGVPLGRTLCVHAETLRGERNRRAEEFAGKAAVKMSIPTVAFILPSLLVTMVAPSFMRFLQLR